MATGKYSDFNIIEEQFYGGMNDVIARNTAAFNGASNNAIRLVGRGAIGNFMEESFFTQMSGLVSRRDITSVSAATDIAFASDVQKYVKVNRKLGPVANTLDSLRKIGINSERMSFFVGQQAGQAKLVDWLDTLLVSGVTALAKTTSGGPSGNGSFLDKSSSASNTMQYSYLIDGLALFGDAGNDIAAWVMHSKAFYDLMKTNVSVATDRVAGATIYEGTAGTLGRPVIVTDSAKLINTDGITSGTDSYYTLGLTANGLVAFDSEEDIIVDDIVTGTENLIYRIQGEHAYNIQVKGLSYTNTGVNPADSALATAGNWTLKMTSVKSTGGFVIEHA